MWLKRLFIWFVRITGIIPYLICFRTKVFYENKKKQSLRIKGKAIVVSNHNSIMDVAVMLFLLWRRCPRTLVAEVMFKKSALMEIFLNALGCIRVNRDSYDYSFIDKCCKILDKGGLIEVYPESRLVRKGETKPLPFKPSTVIMALRSGAPIIPFYNEGVYFSTKSNSVIVGEPFYAREYYDDNLSERENIEIITEKLRDRVIELGKELERQKSDKKD